MIYLLQIGVWTKVYVFITREWHYGVYSGDSVSVFGHVIFCNEMWKRRDTTLTYFRNTL